MSESGDPYTPNSRADIEPTPEEISDAGVYINAAENASQIRDAFTESGKAAVALITGPDGLTWLQAIAEKCGFFGQLHKPTEPGKFEEVVDLRPTTVLLSKNRLGARVERLTPDVDDVLALVMKLIDHVPEYWAAFNSPGNENLRDSLSATIRQRLEQMSTPAEPEIQIDPSVDAPSTVPETSTSTDEQGPDPFDQPIEAMKWNIAEFDKMDDIEELIKEMEVNRADVGVRESIALIKSFARKVAEVNDAVDELIARVSVGVDSFVGSNAGRNSLLHEINRYIFHFPYDEIHPRLRALNTFAGVEVSIQITCNMVKKKLRDKLRFAQMDLYVGATPADVPSYYDIIRSASSDGRNRVLSVVREGYMLGTDVLQRARVVMS